MVISILFSHICRCLAGANNPLHKPYTWSCLSRTKYNCPDISSTSPHPNPKSSPTRTHCTRPVPHIFGTPPYTQCINSRSEWSRKIGRSLLCSNSCRLYQVMLNRHYHHFLCWEPASSPKSDPIGKIQDQLYCRFAHPYRKAHSNRRTYSFKHRK